METPAISQIEKSPYTLASDINGYRIIFVNVFMIGEPAPGAPWALVDAGLYGSSKWIISEAERLFGKDNPPQVIVLTHGHFDHVGALPELLKKWPDVKVYAHAYELPYLTGQRSYPYPDPAAGDGGMSYMSWMFPVKPINLNDRVFPLTADFEIPRLPEWSVVFTPGHAPGHISLFREKDRTLIVGDAFVTTNQNSLFSAFTQKKEMHAPPAYFTINWEDARESVKKLAALNPKSAGCGHGMPVFDTELTGGLQNLLKNFDREIPGKGFYVKHPAPANDERERMPGDAPQSYKTAVRLWKLTMAVAAGVGIAWLARRITHA